MEVTVCVLTIGILAAVAAPKFVDSVDRHRVAAAAARIKTDLSWARQQAMSGSATITVQFNLNTSSFSIPELKDPNHPGQPYVVDLTMHPYDTNVVSADFGGDSQLLYSRFGRPDSEGSVVLQSGNYRQSVSVDADYGAASIP
ncbi:MAG: hypothetical protein B7Z55_09760 [Planctomycetales bacterium 12-60-4]|nr:MAG: hypothetical protein B7Z55_09760 [Planctomycetales bacterium 12-60-4]